MAIRVFTVQAQAFMQAPSIIRSVSHDLALNNLVGYIQEFFQGIAVEHQLGLTQETHVEGWEQVAQDLGLTDLADWVGPVYLSINQPSNVQGEVAYIFGLKAVYEVEHELGLSSVANLVIPLAVTSPLGLTQEAYVSQVVEHANIVTDLVDWGYGYDAEHTIAFVELAEVDAILNQTLTHAGVVSQACAYYIENVCSDKLRGDFHGEGGVAPTPQILEYDSSFLIQSKIDPTNIINLRNPETDNRRRYNFQRVNRNLLDGSVDIFRDPTWVTEQVQIYTIVATKRADLDLLLTFLTDNLGYDVLIKDWKGVTWDVIITNPGEVYTEDGEAYWTVDFEVTGVPTNGEWTAHNLSLSEVLSRSGSIWTRIATDDLGLTTTQVYGFFVPAGYTVSNGNVVTDSVDFVVEVP